MAGTLIKAILATYDLVWKAAIPLLKLNHRLKEGWEERTLAGGLPAKADLWIQAASGGEAYLTWEILKELTTTQAGPLRILVTTNTQQGYETLCRAADDIHARKSGIAVQPWYFPFDSPSLMRTAIGHVRPRMALILETEIWPGFLKACKDFNVRVVLANGRMTTKSLGGYMAWPALFRALGPELIMAVSENDGRRFSTLFGSEQVMVMHNIKFDRMEGAAPMARQDNPLRELIPENADFVVFGSIRRQEADEIERLASGLMRERPSTILGVFPRHMHHVELWQRAMTRVGLKWTLRSTLNTPATPGMVILWDTFGELVPAYGLAKAAFVGGSLAPLGGQNFLEPLTCGVTPVTGPHWKNFTWLGHEIIDSALAIEAKESQGAIDALLKILDETPARDDVSVRARAYIRDRTGGAAVVSKQVADFLNKV